MDNDNHIKVDREDGEINVYSTGDANVALTFEANAAGERAALKYAEHTARRLGCDWSCNF